MVMNDRGDGLTKENGVRGQARWSEKYCRKVGAVRGKSTHMMEGINVGGKTKNHIETENSQQVPKITSII